MEEEEGEKKADALFQLDVVLLQSDTAHVTVKGVIIKKKSVALSLFSIAYCCTATLDSWIYALAVSFEVEFPQLVKSTNTCD